MCVGAACGCKKLLFAKIWHIQWSYECVWFCVYRKKKKTLVWQSARFINTAVLPEVCEWGRADPRSYSPYDDIMLDLEVIPERSLGSDSWEFVLGKCDNITSFNEIRLEHCKCLCVLGTLVFAQTTRNATKAFFYPQTCIRIIFSRKLIRNTIYLHTQSTFEPSWVHSIPHISISKPLRFVIVMWKKLACIGFGHDYKMIQRATVVW